VQHGTTPAPDEPSFRHGYHMVRDGVLWWDGCLQNRVSNRAVNTTPGNTQHTELLLSLMLSLTVCCIWYTQFCPSMRWWKRRVRDRERKRERERERA